MASLQAFGQTGPRRDYVSFGPILMSFSGMTYLWRDPQIERPGAGCQTAFPDYIAPSYGALAILAALHYRAAHRRRAIYRYLASRNCRGDDRAGVLELLDQWPRARSPREILAPCGAPWLLSLQRRRPLVRHRRRRPGRMDAFLRNRRPPRMARRCALCRSPLRGSPIAPSSMPQSKHGPRSTRRIS